MAPPQESDPASGQYFAERPRAASERRELRFLYRGEILRMESDRGVFAHSGLDPGTALLIESMALRPNDSVLDLGCGWGAIGIAAARAAREGRVVMTDVNRRAVQLARRNLERNRVSNAEVRAGPGFVPIDGERFDVIATNPPFHAGRKLLLELFEKTPEHLTPGGRLLVVGKGSQGMKFYQGWLEERATGGVEVLARGSGYRVIEARWSPPSRQR